MKLKNKIIIFALFMFVCGMIGVYAATYFPSNDVTYDNKESGLTSTNVQGAIDELYGKAQQCSSNSNDKVEDMGGTVSSGDGLYADSYEDGRYFYKGKNPNNYITFNDEPAGWRIISLEPDGAIKIIRNDSIGDMAWNSSNNNNWTRPSSLNTYLNSTYYNELNSTAKSQIVTHDFSIGALANTSCLTDAINNENEIIWKGKIALANASEYLRTDSNTNACTGGAEDPYGSVCNGRTNWMYNGKTYWLLTPFIENTSNSTSGAYVVDSAYRSLGTRGGKNSNGTISDRETIRPVVYLSSSVTLSGSGTSSDPYVIN